MDLEYKEAVALSLIKEYVSSANTLIFEVASDYCMRPFLLKGDKIVVKNASLKDLSLGDIVVCQAKDYFYIHRFLYKSKFGLFITKPDNLIYTDSALPENKLIGRAVMIRRDNREINLDTALWNNINFLLGFISLSEVYVFRVLRFIKVLFYKNKIIPFAAPVRRILSFPLRFIILVLRLF